MWWVGGGGGGVEGGGGGWGGGGGGGERGREERGGERVCEGVRMRVREGGGVCVLCVELSEGFVVRKVCSLLKTRSLFHVLIQSGGVDGIQGGVGGGGGRGEREGRRRRRGPKERGVEE